MVTAEDMADIKALLVGESWQTLEFHLKGFDMFANSTYTEAGDHLIEALEHDGIEVRYQPCHQAAEAFPDTPEQLAEFDVVILSDIGRNTLAIPPSTFTQFEQRPERLPLLEDYVKAGGGFCMVGGYLSYQGFEGKAGYRGTPVESILPVSLEPFDDRVERSGGVTPEALVPEHPVLTEVPEEWPPLLGYNRVTLDGGEELLRVGEDPLLAVGEHGAGRSAAFTSDCAPHWGPPAFTGWEGYQSFWPNLIRWLAAG